MTRLRGVASRLRRDDDGQLLLLVLCYTLIGALLVTVVVNVSRAYLYRRSLLAAADGAALAAANQPDLAAVYRGRADGLTISAPGAVAAVDRYAADARLAARFDGFDVVDVGTDGQSVTVTLRAVVHMPFVNLVTAGYGQGYPVDATATARSPFVP